MKLQLQNKLYKNYPFLFAQKNKKLNKTCMMWGIECGDGWEPIIRALCSCITNWQASFKHKDTQEFVFVQIKEKFGLLRIYISNTNDMIDGMIKLAEEMSVFICESCGSTKEVKTGRKGWIQTLCKKCRKKTIR